ncbi:chemotaxis-specific protein-glutamate methyltransferase CheB [Paenibacillus nanensis]|uniref:Protein-glutamate methylesterase/protein-glutamine glutaminase n=1 Tax=Paenibacillus nanensis TaxID=393251 RepID=A0A3A1UTJ4_9BACL|nr:chemotaxis-specific protein-glutamate methyltransferase CheB [Paenibacillus nanensis]RIX51807.1 chemotaxis-specific protein-glutamate methyltransferase CheB [Paenibacillus nanensis]
MAPYRVLVVDDSAFMRKIISDLILQDEQFVIAATAVNGIEAVSAAAEHKPDVITMDLEMPKMNGIEALQLIMKATPTPIIMLSGISEDNTRDTIKALQYGAFDFIRKPTSPASGDIVTVGEQLIEKLRAAVQARRGVKAEAAASVQTREPVEYRPKTPSKNELPETQNGKILKPRGTTSPATAPDKPSGELKTKAKAPLAAKTAVPNTKPVKQDKAGLLDKKTEIKPKAANQQKPPEVKQGTVKPPAAGGKKAGSAASFKHLVAIGTSTGGPRALHEVVCSLPGDFPAPVLIVQHMPPKFTKSLAQRLDSFSALTVVEAEQGMRVSTGFVYIAPGGYHMELARDNAGYAIQLTEAPQRNGHRPSVDVMFESLLPFKELERHAVIMTGMGSDGAKGMKSLAEHGAASTIAEAEETCVVYGMPRSAVECGAAKTVLPLQGIASKLVSAVFI